MSLEAVYANVMSAGDEDASTQNFLTMFGSKGVDEKKRNRRKDSDVKRFSAAHLKRTQSFGSVCASTTLPSYSQCHLRIHSATFVSKRVCLHHCLIAPYLLICLSPYLLRDCRRSTIKD
jgi:hypothetical protein